MRKIGMGSEKPEKDNRADSAAKKEIDALKKENEGLVKANAELLATVKGLEDQLAEARRPAE